MEKSQIWVFMEQRGGVLHEVGLELLGKARELAGVSGSTVAAILLGAEVAPLAPRIINHGADLVLGRLKERGYIDRVQNMGTCYVITKIGLKALQGE